MSSGNAYRKVICSCHKCTNSPGTSFSNYLEGSLKSLTHFVFCVFSHVVSIFVFAVVVIRKYFNVYFAEKKLSFFSSTLVSYIVFSFHRSTGSTGGRCSRGMTTTNKGNKALKVTCVAKCLCVCIYKILFF